MKKTKNTKRRRWRLQISSNEPLRDTSTWICFLQKQREKGQKEQFLLWNWKHKLIPFLGVWVPNPLNSHALKCKFFLTLAWLDRGNRAIKDSSNCRLTRSSEVNNYCLCDPIMISMEQEEENWRRNFSSSTKLNCLGSCVEITSCS